MVIKSVILKSSNVLSFETSKSNHIIETCVQNRRRITECNSIRFYNEYFSGKKSTILGHT